jgi:hypothetical protein
VTTLEFIGILNTILSTGLMALLRHALGGDAVDA